MSCHILGVGNIGSLVAHSLRALPRKPDVTLLLHRPPQVAQLIRQGGVYVRRGTAGSLEEGFQYELLRKSVQDVFQIGARYNIPVGTQNTPVDNSTTATSSPIERLIVTTKASATVTALGKIKKRLNRQSVVVLLQNGMGILERINYEHFPNPDTRPSFVLGTTDHGCTRLDSLRVDHVGLGSITLGLVPREYIQSSIDKLSSSRLSSSSSSSSSSSPPSSPLPLPSSYPPLSSPPSLPASSTASASPLQPSTISSSLPPPPAQAHPQAHPPQPAQSPPQPPLDPSDPALPPALSPSQTPDLVALSEDPDTRNVAQILYLLTAAPALSASLVSYQDIIRAQLQKLVINAAINPLTAVFRCTNGELLYNNYIQSLTRDVVSEAAAVLRVSPVAGLFDSLVFLDPDIVSALVRGVASRTSRNKSSMLQDVLQNVKTEIDHINGYIVHLGKRAGIPTPVNRMLVQMVKGNQVMLKRRHDYIPLLQ